MTKRMLIVVMTVFLIPLISFADDNNRIDELEQQMNELQRKVSELESIIHQEKDEKGHSTISNGWQSKNNWRKLTSGMSISDVKEILGDPHRVDGGSMIIWYYENGGRVIFFDQRVDSWSEPR